MASNAPPAAKGGLHKELFGLPLWSYALGVGAFAIAAFIYFRQGSSGVSGQSSQQPAMPSGTPYPFPNYPGTPSGNVTSPVVNPNAGPQPAVQVNPWGLLTLVTKDESPAQWPQGVPVWNVAHTGASASGYLPYGSQIAVFGKPIQAADFTWYPVALPGGGTGFIASNVVADFRTTPDLTQSAHVGQLVENFNNTATLPNTTNFTTTPNVTTSNVFGASVNSGTVPAPLAPTAA